MVGGRLYIGGEVTRSRRAASVPVEDLRPPVDANVLHQARVISTHAVQDADAMRAASKQHDINFLNDISNKLAAAAQPTHYYRETTPVYIGNRYPPPANHSTVSDLRRRTWYAAPQATDYEVNNYLSGGPQAYRGGRGVSVPPARGPSVPRWHAPSPSRSVRESSASRGYSREKLAPYEDVVVGVAHTSLYGDIVIGIPYHKRHMFDLDGSDLGSSGYKAPHISNGARHSIASNYRNIGTVVTPPSSRRGSVSVPSYRRASISVPSNRRALYDDVDQYLSTTPSYRSSGSHYYSGGYSSDNPSGRPPVAPGRAHSVQRYVDAPQHSSYSSYGPREAATAPVYSSSVTIPYLSSVAPSSSTSSMPPKPPKTYTRPPVSEARRKVRDLLCKSKNDPRYFEGY